MSLIIHLRNAIGWTTKRKILVFESDDWGSIRMPSKSAQKALQQGGVNINEAGGAHFNAYDTLAGPDDLIALFDVLRSVRDRNGRPAVFTALSLVANPDFEKIRRDNFERYHYEPFTDTLARYQGHNKTFLLWQEGIREGLFMPEFHGREHLNVKAWMSALQSGEPKTHLGFEWGCWGFEHPTVNGVKSYQAAFDFQQPEDATKHVAIIEDGLSLFEQIFGYKARLFVPPNGLLNTLVERELGSLGIRYCYAARRHLEPIGNGRLRTRWHYLGQKTSFGGRYSIRNCNFEPAYGDEDWVNNCLREIDIAFRWHKPAILGPHRVNFVGGLDENNRKKGLLGLKSLLQKVVRRWPDIEFMSASELGALMDKKP